MRFRERKKEEKGRRKEGLKIHTESRDKEETATPTALVR